MRSQARYDDEVVGSVVDLQFSLRRRARPTKLLSLEAEGITATCTIQRIEPVEDIITDGECSIVDETGNYRWDTAGLEPGSFRVRFTIGAGLTPAPQIVPADWIEIRLRA